MNILRVIGFLLPIAAILLVLYYYDRLNAWPMTLGVILGMSLGRLVVGRIREPYSARDLEAPWDAASLLCVFLPPALCVLTLCELDWDAWWGIILGILFCFFGGAIFAQWLIGDKDKPGWLRKRMMPKG